MRHKRRRSLHLTSCAKSMTPSCSRKPGFRAALRRSCRRHRGCTELLMAAASHREHGKQLAFGTGKATRAPLRCAPIDNYAYEHPPTLAPASDLARPALTFGACVSLQIHKRTFEHGPARESHTLQRSTNPHAARWHASPSRAGWPLEWALALGALTLSSHPNIYDKPLWARVSRATAA